MIYESRQIGSYAIKSALFGSLVILLLAGIPTAGYFFYHKADSPAGANGIQENLLSGLTKEEMELLLEDVSPQVLKQLKEDPAMRKQQIDNLKQIFALANQAVKEGLNDENTRAALEIIDASVWARTYDREINKDKPAPPFALITERRIREFYGDGADPTAEQKQNNLGFEKFLKVQLLLAGKKSGAENLELSPEEKKQLKDEFARVKIYEREARAKVKAGALPEKFGKKAELNSKLQQVQFLARLYSEDVLANKMEVTDDEVQKYIVEKPELNKSREKQAKALEILQRLKKGEDFAKLAREFSEDSGSKDKGGLYEKVTEGSFDKTFESAALALTPGQITAEPVETQLGFHIIKLERKGQAKDSSGQIKRNYDVRQIFFSTMIKDPENPAAREMSVKEYAKQKLGDEKEKKLMDRILADNPVIIAEDFRVREVSGEGNRKTQPSSTRSNVNSKNSNR